MNLKNQIRSLVTGVAMAATVTLAQFAGMAPAAAAGKNWSDANTSQPATKLTARGSASLAVQYPNLPAGVVQTAGELMRNGDQISGRKLKLSTPLLLLAVEQQSLGSIAQASASGKEFKTALTDVRVADGRVLISAVGIKGNSSRLLADLQTLGLRNGARAGNLVSGWLPVQALMKAGALDSTVEISASLPQTQVGSVTSQGDPAQRSSDLRSLIQGDGTGIKVGVLSDSFNCLGGQASGVASNDLPAGIVVLEEISSCSGAIDEGRAMAEIVHDVAPGAQILFHTAFNGEANFAQGIRDLATAGAQVIVDDVFYFAEPAYMDGVIAQAVDAVVAQGVQYYSSAGNQARQSWEGIYSPITTTGGLCRAGDNDFDTGPDQACGLNLAILNNTSVIFTMQYDRPSSADCSGPPCPAPNSDVDLYLLNGLNGAVLASSESGNATRPFEGFNYTNTTGATVNALIFIVPFSGALPNRLKVSWYSSRVTNTQFATNSPTTFGHANAAGAFAVGAARYSDTPFFGVSPPKLENFSSASGLPIVFDTTGVALPSPVLRAKPEFTGPQCANTTFFGSDLESDGFPNFCGTSASAPHAAAVGALFLQKLPSLTRGQMLSALQASAIDITSRRNGNTFGAGFDNDSGSGLIDAVAAFSGTNNTPNAFSFTDIINGVAGTTYSSETRTLSGFGTANVSLSGDASARVLVNGVDVTANPGTVKSGDTIALRLTAGTAGNAVSTTLTVGSYATTWTVIVPDGSIQFLSGSQSVGESVGTVTLMLRRTGVGNAARRVNYSTVNGSATAPRDYLLNSGTVHWASGDTADKPITVSVVDDSALEAGESFSVQLSNPVGGSLGSIGSSSIAITDNDSEVAFAASSYTVSESGSTVTLSVSRTGNFQSAASVNFATSNGSAMAGSDYSSRTGSLNWASGDGSAKTIAITILNDAAAESSESFSLRLSAPVGTSLGRISSATVAITDDDATGSVQFLAASTTVGEAARNAILTLRRSSGSSNAMSVTYASANGSASSPADFGAVSGTLSWAAGDTADKTISVPIVDDTASEASESFQVQLGSPSGATLGANASSTVTISDNDSRVEFSPSSYSLSEAGGTARLTVTRIGSGAGAVSVNFATSNGSAVAGSDYNSSSGTLNWADGDTTSKTISVIILNDAVVEPAETFTVTLSNPSGTSLGSGRSNAATVSITNDD